MKHISCGRNGLDKFSASYDDDNQVEIYLNGAHVTSWVAKGRERLFVSDSATFSKGEAIRGGIPLVFPQFGKGILQSHGFARNEDWVLDNVHCRTDNAVEATFFLSQTDYTSGMWDYDFTATYVVTLSESLQTTLVITNTGDKPFQFQSALHTYFAITDINEIGVEGLQGATFFDSLEGGKQGKEARDAIGVEGEVDRIYVDTDSSLSIRDQATKDTITVKKTGFPDAVLWNPWIERSAEIKDLPDDAYQAFVCLEAGAIAKPITLAPGQRWEAFQVLSVN